MIYQPAIYTYSENQRLDGMKKFYYQIEREKKEDLFFFCFPQDVHRILKSWNNESINSFTLVERKENMSIADLIFGEQREKAENRSSSG